MSCNREKIDIFLHWLFVVTEPIGVFKEYYVCIKYFIERDNNRKKMMMDLLRNKNLF